MCGRLTQQRPSEELAELFGAEDLIRDAGGRYNVAPTERLHHRMRVILDPDDWPPWLDPTIGDPGELLGLLGPHRADDLLAVPLGSGVNCPPLGPGMARVLSREQYSCTTLCRSSLALRGQRVIGFERREVDGGQAPRYR